MDWVENEGLGIWFAEKIKPCRNLYIASPYITVGGLQQLIDELKRPRRKLSVTILTCLEPIPALTGALDISALIALLNLSTEDHPVRIYHVPNLHAKVFIVDKRAGVVGSGNLTWAGTQGTNIELGIRITSSTDIQEVTQRLQTWIAERSALTVTYLERFHRLVEENFGKEVRRVLDGITWGRLEIFPGKDTVDYFNVMQAILKQTIRGCPKSLLLELLRNSEQGREGSQTAQARLLFLQFMNLLEKRDEDRFWLTDTGKSVTRSGGSRVFTHLLLQEFPVVQRILGAFCCSERGDLTYPELAAVLAGGKTVPQDATDEVKDAVRWLRSLGLVEVNEIRIGHYMHFRVSKAGRLEHKRFVVPKNIPKS